MLPASEEELKAAEETTTCGESAALCEQSCQALSFFSFFLFFFFFPFLSRLRSGPDRPFIFNHFYRSFSTSVFKAKFRFFLRCFSSCLRSAPGAFRVAGLVEHGAHVRAHSYIIHAICCASHQRPPKGTGVGIYAENERKLVGLL